MVKKFLLFIALFFMLTLCGCEYFTGASAGRIFPPPDKANFFEGKWEVLEAFGQATPAYDEAARLIGSSVQFSEDAIVFDSRLWESPSYRIKRINAEAYLTTKDITVPYIAAKGIQTADVLTIYAAGNYLGEFMKISESNMILFVEGNGFLLTKISGQADAVLRDVYAEAQGTGSDNSDAFSGALIGLRAKSQQGNDTYRTIWIAASIDLLRPVLTSDHIFFPRMSGFWECVSEDADGEGQGNNLIARGAFARGTSVQEPEDEESDDAMYPLPSLNIIHYIGNDYVSAESIADSVSQLNVLPVDSLSSPVKIKVADLLGENGFMSYENARADAVLALKSEGASAITAYDDGENFGLVREKGHWKLVGRVNYHNEGSFEHSDFDLKIIPPNNLVFFDTLALNWNRIKDRVPDALDVFTSPDKNIALVKTKNKITVYAIGTEQLSENSLGEIELAEGETIVMAEWATAIYVDSWERAFIAYGAREL